MTKKRKKGGGSNLFGGCFGQRDEHPDIQINPTTAEKLIAPQMTDLNLQMPPPEEWRSKFVELVVSITYIRGRHPLALKEPFDSGFHKKKLLGAENTFRHLKWE